MEADNTYFSAVRKKLFASDRIELSAVVESSFCTAAGVVESLSIQNDGDLDELLSRDGDSASDEVAETTTILLVPQSSSWGRLLLTSSAFDRVVEAWNVSQRFKNIVASFGFKDGHDERRLYSFQFCGDDKSCLRSQHEAFYILHHVEKHGRELKDPWSLRQVGVYEQQDSLLRKSRWLFLNPSEQIASGLSNANKAHRCKCRLSAHVSLLESLGANWTEYVEYLSSETMQFHEKSCYSRIDRGKDSAFCATYPDLQKICLLQAKIDRAESSLESCSEIAEHCRTHVRVHDNQGKQNAQCSRCTDLLLSYVAEMQIHRRHLQRLDKRLRITSDMLSKIIAYRNEDLLQATNRASSRTLDALLNITTQGREQQKVLVDILNQGKIDSAILKALSVVATVYLPPSLIATVFSSSLVQPVGGEGNQHVAPRLALSPEFWVYLAIAVPIMTITFVWIVYFDRNIRRKGSMTSTSEKHNV